MTNLTQRYLHYKYFNLYDVILLILQIQTWRFNYTFKGLTTLLNSTFKSLTTFLNPRFKLHLLKL